jgi:hypothetical protein
MRRTLAGMVVVATALPAGALATIAATANQGDMATRLRRRSAGVPLVAQLVTAPLWLIVLLRGVLYPVLGSGHLENSWGGPTLAGAWAVHLMIGTVTLLVVSFILALWRSPGTPSR